MKLLKGCLILIILLCMINACSLITDTTLETPTPNPDLDIDKIDSPGLTIIMAKSPVYDNDKVMAEYAAELLSHEGWNVNFKFFDFYKDYDIHNDPLAYQNFIMAEVESGNDVIFESKGVITLDDFSAKRYLARTDKGLYDFHRYMGRRSEYSFQGIFIRKDLDELYGEKISCIEDYDLFLTWAQLNAPDTIPCLMVMQYPRYDSFNPISLFAQIAGYSKIDSVVSGIRDDKSTLYMSDIDMLNYENDTPDVYEAVELPFFLEMDRYMNKWVENNMVQFTSYDGFESTSGYSSIVCNMNSATDYYSVDYTRSDSQLLDMSNYNLYVLLSDDYLPYTPHVFEYSRSSDFWFVSEKPSMSLGSAFLEWIYSSTDNYLLFMFGEEGVDYKVVDGQLEFLTNPNGLSYGEWPAHEKFIDDTLNPIMPHFPSNWLEVQSEISQLKPFRIIASSMGETKDGIEYSTNELVNQMNSLSAVDSGTYSLYLRYFQDLGKGEDRYTPWDLRVDIEQSVAAMERKNIYTDILVFARENN